MSIIAFQQRNSIGLWGVVVILIHAIVLAVLVFLAVARLDS